MIRKGKHRLLAKTPHFDRICKRLPSARLTDLCPDVGLPQGQNGENSRSGAYIIGAVLRGWPPMDLGVRLILGYEEGAFAKHQPLPSFNCDV